jgi:hypothetical protein
LTYVAQRFVPQSIAGQGSLLRFAATWWPYSWAMIASAETSGSGASPGAKIACWAGA